MPIEIKELHIKINVEEESKSNTQKQSSEQPMGAGDKSAIIAECTEQVLEVLKNKLER